MFTSPTLRRLVVAVGSLAVAATAAGCSAAEAAEPTGAVAVVLGARSNMPPPVLDSAAEAALKTAVQDQSLALFVIADGEPAVEGKRDLVTPGENETGREGQRQEWREWVKRSFEGAAAQDEETDLLGALDLAARAISSAPGTHTIVVVDSGLSTAGDLDFAGQPELLDADPEELAESLAASDALPDLTGVRVVVQGIGDTAEPQEELSTAQRRHLVELWEAMLATAGATEVVVEETPLSGSPSDGLPRVTPVGLPQPVQCVGGAIELSGADVAFQPNSAEFVEAAAARAVLEPIAKQLVGTGATATLTGTTARVGDLKGQRALSEQRAQAVLEELVELRVPRESLTAVGLGSEFPGYAQDHDAAGNLLPGPAAANRQVIITLDDGAAWTLCD
ncbi:OmpA family protein [Geodermatophilus sp. SYSU D01176]